MAKKRRVREPYREIRQYRGHLKMSQAQLAHALGVTQAYISQLERGRRQVTTKLAARLAKLPDLRRLPATVFPEDAAGLDRIDADFAADLGAMGYPGFGSDERPPKNPAAIIVGILKRKQVAPGVMAAIPWVLLRFPDLNTGWLVDQARLNNLQNRLGFLTDLAIEIAEMHLATDRIDEAHLLKLQAMREHLEDSRLAKDDTLARPLSPSERQFFDENRSETARHWNLLTGLTRETLPFVGRE